MYNILVARTRVEIPPVLQAVLQGVGHTVTVAANQQVSDGARWTTILMPTLQDASLLAAEYAFRALLISDQIEASQAETLEREARTHAHMHTCTHAHMQTCTHTHTGEALEYWR